MTVRRSVRAPEDPEAGVHVARVDEAGFLVDEDAPDLRRLRQVLLCEGLTGFCPAGGTKNATSSGLVGSLASTTRTPSEYQEMYTSVPMSIGLWIV